MSQRSSRRPLAAKVPEVTALFWVIKLLTTAMGEAAADYLAGVSILLAAVLGFAGFGIAMWAQLRARTYVAQAYWFAVAMVAVFGTMGADALHIVFLVPYSASTALCLVAMAIVFTWWHHSEGTLSIHSIITRRRELFYWTAVLAAFAMGTAIGDLTATTFGLGFLGSVVLFAVLISVPALGWRLLGWNEVGSFWAAYALTRPLGASVADWLGKPTWFGHGLGLGDGPVALVSTLVIIGFVAYAAGSRHGIQRLSGDLDATQSRLLYHHLPANHLHHALRTRILHPQPLHRRDTTLNNLPEVVWLTDDPHAATPLNPDPGTTVARLTVAVPHARHWPVWAHVYRLPRRVHRRLGTPAQQWGQRWWVVEAPIPAEQWISIVSVPDGRPIWPPSPADRGTGAGRAHVDAALVDRRPPVDDAPVE